jgi:hypothetical protein
VIKLSSFFWAVKQLCFYEFEDVSILHIDPIFRDGIDRQSRNAFRLLQNNAALTAQKNEDNKKGFITWKYLLPFNKFPSTFCDKFYKQFYLSTSYTEPRTNDF